MQHSKKNILHYLTNFSDLNFLGDKVIEPGSVTAVVLKTVSLKQLCQKLDRRPKVSAD